MGTKIIVDFLGVNLSEKQALIAFALSAGGAITEIKDPVSPAVRYYIQHPNSGACIAIANRTLGVLKKKGIVDAQLKFVQSTLFPN